jgi:hypothetical protein
VCAKLEHAIGVIKRIVGSVKVRYRGLEKNAHRLFVTCALQVDKTLGHWSERFALHDVALPSDDPPRAM